jgi:hypothetical protein
MVVEAAPSAAFELAEPDLLEFLIVAFDARNLTKSTSTANSMFPALAAIIASGFWSGVGHAGRHRRGAEDASIVSRPARLFASDLAECGRVNGASSGLTRRHQPSLIAALRSSATIFSTPRLIEELGEIPCLSRIGGFGWGMIRGGSGGAVKKSRLRFY